jgi:dipeptidyl aminopeptidase/acylaminoacyl peptidase
MNRAAFLFLCFLTFSLSYSHAASLSTSEIFSMSAEYSDVKISPQGDYISALTTHDGKKTLLILQTDTKKLTNAISFPGNAEVGDYEWVNNERIVLQKMYLKGWSEQPIYYGELMSVNADGTNVKYLFGYNNGEAQIGSNIKKNTAIRATAYILDPLPNDSKYMLVNAISWGTGSSLDYSKQQHVYRVDVNTGKRKRLMTSPIGYTQFLTDNEGEVKFASGVDNSNKLKLFYRENGEWVDTVNLQLGLDDFTPISFADKPNTIFAAGRVKGETLGVYKVDLSSGKKEKIIQDINVDPSDYWINKNSKQLYAVEFSDGYPAYDFVNTEDSHSKLLEQLLASLPGHQIHIVSETSNANKFIIKAFNDRNPGDYYLFNVDKMKLEYLVSQKSWLDPEKMAEVKPISFTSRDGLTIQGYLTLPNDKEAKNLPLIVNPHGGPHGTRDWWGFDAQNQLLAQEGFAVLQVNFRGSGGYGRKFEEAGYLKWGNEVQFDIIDGTQYIIDQGIVNKEKICIAGGSFGGYSALQSSIVAPDLFKCAIGFSGLYDLPLWKEDSDVSNSKSGKAYQHQVLGKDIAALQLMSPSYNVNKLKAKLLLVHGADDERTPLTQLESLEKSLSDINYPYEKLVMDDEGHGFYNDSHRAKYYQKMLKFLKDNLDI